MSTLQERIDELVYISKLEHPNIPEWYIQLAVERYVREEEYENFKDEIDGMIQEVVTSEENTCTINKEEECPC